MKIEVSGKGGSGKSTVSVLLARAMRTLGYRVLLVDGDESNIGLEMLVIGKIHHFGEGCVCPMGVLSKKFLASLETGEKEIVLVDAEAGVEHFGRGIVGECDLILGVVDPTAESFQLADKMARMAARANKKIRFVLNKVEPEIEAVMKQKLTAARVIGMIPKDHLIFMESLEGKALTRILPEVDAISREILMDDDPSS